MRVVYFFVLIFTFVYFPSFSQSTEKEVYQCYSIEKKVVVYLGPDEKSGKIAAFQPRVIFDVSNERDPLFYKVKLPYHKNEATQFGFVKKQDVVLVLTQRVEDLGLNTASQSAKIKSTKPIVGEKPKVECRLCPNNSSKNN